jgi:hypothetical protein
MFSSNTSQVSSSAANYIEDVFSTYLYTGTGSSQTITNNINTTTYGGLVWIKGRSGATGHRFTNTARGTTKSLASDSTAAEATESTGLTAFGTTGFTIGADADYNTNAATYVSWTFRKQAKFFDVVTYTGDGVAGRTVAHNLGSVPGCIMVKKLSAASNWKVYHRSLNATNAMYLNLNNASFTSTDWNNTTPTSTEFTVGNSSDVNDSGGTYVAYIFAHDAGGFGLTGTDNVISCGTYTGNLSADVNVTLGYEPQWILMKRSGAVENWYIFDTMRGCSVASPTQRLFPNSNSAEDNNGSVVVYPTATGFTVASGQSTGATIYIAIRRGPMKAPTSGTSVFTPIAQNAVNPTSTVTTNFPVDMAMSTQRTKANWADTLVNSRLTGSSSSNSVTSYWLQTRTTGAQLGTACGFGFDNNTGYIDSAWGDPSLGFAAAGTSIAYWNFRRAPGFMDVVCYTGTGTAGTKTHNLGVVPEFMIVKRRNAAGWDWATYHSAVGNTKSIALNSTGNPITLTGFWNNTTPTSSVFTTGNNGATNASGGTYVAYLFATCAGVSKVGSYTGNGSSQTIDCGFTGGARFVLIRRTDAAADWYVWDSARGIVAANDPHLSLNTTAAEVTTDDSVDTNSTGFVVNQLAATDINVSSSTYIFLAIA